MPEPSGHRRASRLANIPILQAGVQSMRDVRAALIDRWLRINTCGSAVAPTSSAQGDAVFYEPTDYRLLQKYIKPLGLKGDDVVFDVGCGMGRTVCILARRTIRKCVGIEIDPLLAECARSNAVTLRGRRATIEIRLSDAAVADYSDGTVFWFNNPFGSKTMEATLERIEESLKVQPRRIQIAYVYPIHERVLWNCSWLRCVNRLRPLLYSTSQAVYWTNYFFASVGG
ncbi:MAG: class I SAM-dependent methyltransferase [Phycisphaerales bacterium]|nr:class I SAM-dependent methyltransferase [Phycisphaerales bacterium]